MVGAGQTNNTNKMSKFCIYWYLNEIEDEEIYYSGFNEF